MATYNFNYYLEFVQKDVKPNKQNETTIFLIARRKQHLLRYRTPFKVHPFQWDKEKQEVKKNKTGYASINNTLGNIKEVARVYYYDCLKDGEPFTHRGLKSHLDAELGLEPKETQVTLFAFIEQLITDSAITKEKNTTKNYTSTQNHLLAFSKTNRLKKYDDFADVNLNFYYEFVSYLGNEGLALNSIGKHVKNLKAFMSEAYDRGFHQNTVFRSRKFKVFRVDTEKIYLNDEELKMIFDLDLSNNPKLDRVRDAFLVSAFTGLRFSDLERLSKQNIIDGFIHIVPRKTKTLSPNMLVIPIKEEVQQIFDKYEKSTGRIMPPIISNQKMNEYLKTVGEQAGITYPYTFEERVGQETLNNSVPKNTLITTHCGRRSYCTNEYDRGTPTVYIMRTTGHKTESAFLSYIRRSKKDSARRIKEGWEKEKTK